MTQPKTDLAYLRSEKAKAEQKLRFCQHREKILERQMSELNRRERVHRLCTRAGIQQMDVSKFYHGGYYLEELKTIEGKRFGDRGKHQFK